MIELLNCDCITYMRGLPDNAFDLAIVDPPYGINIGNAKPMTKTSKQDHIKKDWDLKIPDKNYFDELERVSVNRIIWGANYFTCYLPPSMGWIFWDKDNHKFSLSDGELAFTSFKKKLTVFKRFANLDRGFMCPDIHIHPTQKPVKLYQWLLENYAKPGQRILDTHLGSGSSAIAAHYYGVDFVGCELDKDYYDAACKRFALATAQVDMFSEVSA